MSERLGTVRDSYHSFLDCTSRHVCGPSEEVVGVHLPGAGYPKDRGWWAGGSRLAAESEVGEIFRGSRTMSILQ